MFKKNNSVAFLTIRKHYSEAHEMSTKSGIRMAQSRYVYTFLKDEEHYEHALLASSFPSLSPIRCLVLALPSHLLMADNTLSPPGKQLGSLLLPHKTEGIIRTMHLLSPPVTRLVYIHVKIHAVRVI